METVAHAVVHLHCQGQQHAAPILIKPPHGEDGRQIIVPVLQVQIEPFKTSPGHHGHREGVGRRIGSGHQSRGVAVCGHIPLPGGAELPVIRGIGRPQVGESLGILMKNGIAGMDHIIIPWITFLIQCHAEFLMPVHHGGQVKQHGRVQLFPPLPQPGNV